MQFESKILFLIVIGIILYLSTKRENMSNEDITSKIQEIYKADIGAIRNLSKLANDLTKQGSLSVKGGLKVDGPLDFLPKGSIIAWNGTTAPKGWAVCDGKTVEGYKTPDLRGRFIRMHTEGLVKGEYQDFNMKAGTRDDIKGKSRTIKKSTIMNHKFGEYAGTDHMILDKREMPKHNHGSAGNHKHKYNAWDAWNVTGQTRWGSKYGNAYFTREQDQRGGQENRNGLYDARTVNAGSHTHSYEGNNWSHNNMPAYYVLTWIVKVI